MYDPLACVKWAQSIHTSCDHTSRTGTNIQIYVLVWVVFCPDKNTWFWFDLCSAWRLEIHELGVDLTHN